MNPFEEDKDIEEKRIEKSSTNPFDDSISSFQEEGEDNEEDDYNAFQKENEKEGGEENIKGASDAAAKNGLDGRSSPKKKKKKKKKKKGLLKKEAEEKVVPTLKTANSNPFDSDDDDDEEEGNKGQSNPMELPDRSSTNPFDDDDDVSDNEDIIHTESAESAAFSTTSSTHSQNETSERRTSSSKKKEKTNFFRRSRSKSPTRDILQEVNQDEKATPTSPSKGNAFMNKIRRSRSKSPSRDLLESVENHPDNTSPPPASPSIEGEEEADDKKKRSSLLPKIGGAFPRRRSKSPSRELLKDDEEEEFMLSVKNLDLENDDSMKEIKTFHNSADLGKDLNMDFSGWGTKDDEGSNRDDNNNSNHENSKERGEVDPAMAAIPENDKPCQDQETKESSGRRGFFGRIQRKKSKDEDTTAHNENTTNPFDDTRTKEDEVYRVKPDQCVQFIHQKQQQQRSNSGSNRSVSSTSSSQRGGSATGGGNDSTRRDASGSGSSSGGGGLFPNRWFHSNSTEESPNTSREINLSPENEELCKSMKEEDVDADLAILEAMDIDSDFNAWTSFRSMSSPPKSAKTSTGEAILEEEGGEEEVTETPIPKLSRDEIMELRKWSARAEREEIYSFKYRPVPREEKEMSGLASFLGLSRSKHGGGGSGSERGRVGKLGGLIGSGGSGSGSERSKANSSRSNSGYKKRPILSTLFYPADYEPKSILLKRGPVLRNNQERELILLTHGFVIATVASPSATNGTDAHKTPSETNGTDASTPDWAAGADDNNDAPSPPKSSTSPSPGTKKKGFNKLFSNMPAAIAKKVIRRNYESCAALSNVVDVSDLALIPLDNNNHIMNEASIDNEENKIHHNLSNENAFSITTMEEEGHRLLTTTHVFVCAFLEHKQAWLHALEISVIRAHMYNHLSDSNYENGGASSSQLMKKRKIGWQHEIIRTSLHSAAYYDDLEMLRRAITLPTKSESNSTTLSPITSTAKSQGGIDALDDYGDKLSALHYASMKNHLECMEELLKAGANPNVLDGNGKPPLWYADQNKHAGAVKLLLSNGADKKCLRKDDNSNNNNKGTLFGNIGWQRQAAPQPAPQPTPQSENHKTVETYTFRHNRKKGDATTATKNADSKAKNVSNVMSENMDALRKRGERIEQLDEKTRELQNEAKNYRDMARQLKEKQKKQATFLGFKL